MSWSHLPITNNGIQPFITAEINQLATLLPHHLGIYCSFPWINFPILSSFKMELTWHFLHEVHNCPCWRTFLPPLHGSGTLSVQLIWYLMHIHYSWAHLSPIFGVNTFKGKVNFMHCCILLKVECHAWHSLIIFKLN